MNVRYIALLAILAVASHGCATVGLTAVGAGVGAAASIDSCMPGDPCNGKQVAKTAAIGAAVGLVAGAAFDIVSNRQKSRKTKPYVNGRSKRRASGASHSAGTSSGGFGEAYGACVVGDSCTEAWDCAGEHYVGRRCDEVDSRIFLRYRTYDVEPIPAPSPLPPPVYTPPPAPTRKCPELPPCPSGTSRCNCDSACTRSRSKPGEGSVVCPM